MTRAAVVAVAVVLGGCFQAHDGGPATPVADVGESAVPVDPLPDWPEDEPLPGDPEPDLGPDARPSDYPDAADWEPPSAPVDCCDLGEPVLVEPAVPSSLPAGIGGGPLQVEWASVGWGVFLIRGVETDEEMGLVRLAPEGAVVADARALGPAGVSFFRARWAAGRYGLVAREGVRSTGIGGSGWRDPPGLRFGLYDGRGAPDGARVDLVTEEDGRGTLLGLDVVYLAHGDRWLVMLADQTLLTVSSVGADGLEGTQILSERPASGQMVGLRSRAAIVTGPEGAIRTEMFGLLSFGWPPEDRLEVNLPAGRPIGTVALRDTVVVFLRSPTDDHANSAVVVDPFEGEVVSSSRPWTAPTTGGGALTTDAKRGRIGRCFTDDAGVVYFQLHAHDGLPLTEPIVVAEPTQLDNWGCSIGFDGSRYLVAWHDIPEGVFARAVSTREE